MGRPPLPKGESKDIQIGLRFKTKENVELERAAQGDKKDKVSWIRQAALEATKAWITCDQWTPAQLQGKKVCFRVKTILEGDVEGRGIFDVWQRGDGKCKIRIVAKTMPSLYKKDTLSVYLPQRGVKLIKQLPAGSDCDFSVIDPTV